MAKEQKVIFNDKTFTVLQEVDNSVMLTDGTEAFIVSKSKTKPAKEKKNVQKQEVAEAEESDTCEG